jgi:putative DNA primase/helicase
MTDGKERGAQFLDAEIARAQRESRGETGGGGVERFFGNASSTYKDSEQEMPFGERRIITLRASEVQTRPIEWLIEDWIPRGKLTILAGQAGTGKTTLALKFAAMATAGGTLPDGSMAKGGGNVLMWSGEDEPEDVLVPRLKASGADITRCFFVSGAFQNGRILPFDPTRDIPLLDKKAKALGGLDLLIVDPVISLVGGDSHKAAEVRKGLQPLVDFAMANHCAALGITHFAKGSKGKAPQERVIGSQAFSAVARMVLGVAVDDEENTRTLLRMKTNIAKSTGGLSYFLKQTLVDGEIETTFAEFGETVAGSASEILSAAEGVDPDGGTPLREEKQFLLDLLCDGSLSAMKILKEAKEAGLSKSSIDRAKKKLGILSRKTSMDGGWVWTLPRVETTRMDSMEREEIL